LYTDRLCHARANNEYTPIGHCLNKCVHCVLMTHVQHIINCLWNDTPLVHTSGKHSVVHARIVIRFTTRSHKFEFDYRLVYEILSKPTVAPRIVHNYQG
jgi:hypothetical protein